MFNGVRLRHSVSSHPLWRDRLTNGSRKPKVWTISAWFQFQATLRWALRIMNHNEKWFLLPFSILPSPHLSFSLSVFFIFISSFLHFSLPSSFPSSAFLFLSHLPFSFLSLMPSFSYMFLHYTGYRIGPRNINFTSEAPVFQEIRH